MGREALMSEYAVCLLLAPYHGQSELKRDSYSDWRALRQNFWLWNEFSFPTSIFNNTKILQLLFIL